jgi:RNA binding exosome subunit
MIGYIMKKRQIAMGIETWYTERESKVVATLGAILPRRIPAAMHRATHRVKYLSKMVNRRSIRCTSSWCFL